MPLNTFVIDQSETFEGVIFMQCNPRMKYGTQEQDTQKDGTPKWEVELLASTKGFNGKLDNDVIRVGIASYQDPGQGISMYTPVVLPGFAVGVMDRRNVNKATGEMTMGGAQIYFRADGIQAVQSRAKSD